MNSSIKLTALIFAIAPLTPAPAFATAQDVARNTALLFVGISGIKYCFFSKPTEDPDRYNVCELANGQNIPANLYYLYADGLLGHDEKEIGFEVKASDKSSEENIVIKKKKIPARGIVGKLHANYLKPFQNFILLIVTFRKFKDEVNNGVEAWKNFNFSELITLKNPGATAEAPAKARAAHQAAAAAGEPALAG